MKHISSHPFHKTVSIGLLLVSMTAMTVYGHETVERNTVPCAAAASSASQSAASSASAHGSHASTDARAQGTYPATASSCAGADCLPSSEIRAGHGRVSGSSSLPGAPSVTVHAKDGVISSSTVTSSGATRSSGSSASSTSSTSSDKDCTVSKDVRTDGRAPENQTEKRRIK